VSIILSNLHRFLLFASGKRSGKQGNVGTRWFWQTTKQGGSGKNNETLKTKAVLTKKETWETWESGKQENKEAELHLGKRSCGVIQN
jgi:hypothetical protein